MRDVIRKHTDLTVYKKSFAAAMEIFESSKSFPKDERYSLTDQIRRSSRSVAANLAEAWRKRRYKAAISKLSDCEAEAAEKQTWIQFAVDCCYLHRTVATDLYKQYEEVISMLVHMIHHADQWTIKND